MTYLDLMVFLTFHTCSLTPLEPNLTVVAWRTKKKVRAVALKSIERELRSSRGIPQQRRCGSSDLFVCAEDRLENLEVAGTHKAVVLCGDWNVKTWK